MIKASSPSNKLKKGLVAGPFVLLLALSGCKVSSEELEYSRAEQAQAKSDHKGALKHYKAIVEKYQRSPLAIKAAKEAARINHYQLKQPKEAINYYKHVVLYSPAADERLDAQKKIADLHFSQTLDYTQAIIEFSRLLELPHTSQEDFSYRLSIARSYFYLSNFYQAQVEIDTILKRNYEKDLLFDAMLLKANIFLTTKRLDDAIATLKQVMEKYPDRSKTETIGLVLAIVYEEQKNFAKAIETLESIKDIYPKKEFIEQRIRVLKERQSYLPGAKGFKK